MSAKDNPTQVIPFLRGGEEYINLTQFNLVWTQLNRVLASFLAENNGQGLPWVNPYVPVGAPNNGDIPVWDSTSSPPAYRPRSLAYITGFGFQVVPTFSSFTMPTIPSFGYTQDTGLPYFFSPVFGNWQIIGTVLPP